MSTEMKLLNIFSQYKSHRAVDGRELFWKKIAQFEKMDDWEMEGYLFEEKDAQRDMSVKFEWGHDHDFGDVWMSGKMGNRHVKLINTFVDEFGLPMDLTANKVLDVGVWTGGTTLLLSGMGAKVNGIEEVAKYAECANYLLSQFSKNEIHGRVWNDSIYELPDKAPNWMEGYFDIIIFPGVLYHLTDPILALRILFNCLKDGGVLYIETAGRGIYGNDSIIQYAGAGKPGWNWFIPNEKALFNMLVDTGFIVSKMEFKENNRIYAKAFRDRWRPMLQAGISRRIR